MSQFSRGARWARCLLLFCGLCTAPVSWAENDQTTHTAVESRTDQAIALTTNVQRAARSTSTNEEVCLCNGCQIAGRCYPRAAFEWCTDHSGQHCLAKRKSASLEIRWQGVRRLQEAEGEEHEGHEAHEETDKEEEFDEAKVAKVLAKRESSWFSCAPAVRSSDSKASASDPDFFFCPIGGFALFRGDGSLMEPMVCCRYVSPAEAHRLFELEMEVEGVSGVELVAAVMLLGSVTFVMSMFYLVHHPDPDIRRHSWVTLSTTMSIFTAVLQFQAWNGLLDMWLLSVIENGETSLKSRVVASYGVFFLCFLILQGVIAAIAFKQEPAAVFITVDIDEHDVDKAGVVKREFEKQKNILMKCWASLCSHVSAFGAIHAGSELVQLEFFRSSLPMMAFCVALQMAGLFAIFVLSDVVRHRFETKEEVFTVWDEVNEEAENDIASLAISYLMVLVFRIQLSRPPEHAAHHHSEDHGGDHGHGQHHGHGPHLQCSASALFVFCIFSALGTMFMVCIVKGRKPDSYASRIFLLGQSTCAMAFSWSAYFGARELIGAMRLLQMTGLDMESHGVPMSVMLACALSTCGFLLIFALDFIADLDATGETADKVIANLIAAIGILVGFSWERCFDVSVEVISELTFKTGEWYPVITKLILAMTIALGIVPAWRKHILQKAVELSSPEHRAPRRGRTSVFSGSYTPIPNADPANRYPYVGKTQ